jgi:nitrogen fixation protein NifU and related proteins
MTDLGDLYQEMILEHYKSPRNFGVLESADRVAHGDNPLCGDKIALTVKLKGEVIEDIKFKGSGCAISTASASLMTEAVKGKTKADAEALYGKFHPMVMGTGSADGVGKLEVFSGVSEFPIRVKCATLAWHTLRAALDGKKDSVSTE